MRLGRESDLEMSKHARVIGTSEAAISKAELELGFTFPESFRNWLLLNNGRSIEDITIFPVFDERDARKTWDSIVRNYNNNWKSWLDNYGSQFDFSNLLPFGEFGTGDYFCFDFSQQVADEPAVVIWSHETGRTENVASDFQKFIEMAEAGAIDY